MREREREEGERRREEKGREVAPRIWSRSMLAQRDE
jgi:hypothetical protein